MLISVRKGIGTGPTELAAFDQALVNAGVANFNLLYLSSVLPPGSDVRREHHITPVAGEWGDKLYVVMAQSRTNKVNREAWAGVGWIQDAVTKKGLLVEHEGDSEQEVHSDITHSLSGLALNRGIDFGEQHMEMAGVKCTGDPVCALVVAVFESEGWANATPESKIRTIANKLRARSKK
jgi:arginine decarboxylase